MFKVILNVLTPLRRYSTANTLYIYILYNYRNDVSLKKNHRRMSLLPTTYISYKRK